MPPTSVWAGLGPVDWERFGAVCDDPDGPVDPIEFLGWDPLGALGVKDEGEPEEAPWSGSSAGCIG